MIKPMTVIEYEELMHQIKEFHTNQGKDILFSRAIKDHRAGKYTSIGLVNKDEQVTFLSDTAPNSTLQGTLYSNVIKWLLGGEVDKRMILQEPEVDPALVEAIQDAEDEEGISDWKPMD